MFLIQAQNEFMEAIGCNKSSFLTRIWRAHKKFMSPTAKSKFQDVYLAILTLIVFAEVTYGIGSLINKFLTY